MGDRNTTPLYGSVAFIVVYVILATIISFYARARTKDPTMKTTNFLMGISLTFMGMFCLWTMWICAFMHQMNTMIFPIVMNPEG